MVKGLDIFRDYFKDFESCYTLIGGTACDFWLSGLGLRARATKDLDLVLIVEALDSSFVSRFWEFTRLGAYEAYTDKQDRSHYYRFQKPKTLGYPDMLELFSRRPKALEPVYPGSLTVIPVDAGISSLSAILLDEEYYRFILATTERHDDLSLVIAAGLIPLKVRAYLDLSKRKAIGEDIDSRNIDKHKNDIFRLALILPEEPLSSVSGSIRDDLRQFFDLIPISSMDMNILRKETRFQLPIDRNALLSSIKRVYGI
jgi:hypothetical protein